MAKIKVSTIPTNELIALESASRLLYSQAENEYISYRSQFTPQGLRSQQEVLENMEGKVKLYGDIRRKLVDEIALRLENINFEK